MENLVLMIDDDDAGNIPHICHFFSTGTIFG